MKTQKHTKKVDPIFFIDNPLFHRPNAKKIFADIEASMNGKGRRNFVFYTEVPGWRIGRPKVETLDKEEEKAFFLLYNYYRYQLSLEKSQSSKRAKYLVCKIAEIKRRLVNLNFALVAAMAERFHHDVVDMDELISDGNITLLKSINKFDASRGFKFSTYACRSILRTCGRAVAKATLRQGRYPLVSVFTEPAEKDNLSRDLENGILIEKIGQMLERLVSQASPMAADILLMRYGFHPYDRGHTLNEIGRKYGIDTRLVRKINTNNIFKAKALLLGS